MKSVILVVDDYACIRELFEIVLHEEFLVIKASTGREALSIIKSRADIKLVLLDYEMPEMNGLDTLQGIKAINKKIPVCMVSSENDSAIILKAKQLGAIDYIVKPFDVNTINKTIKKILKLTPYT